MSEVYELGNQKLPSTSMTEKFAVEVDAKIGFGKNCKNLQVSLFNEDV